MSSMPWDSSDSRLLSSLASATIGTLPRPNRSRIIATVAAGSSRNRVSSTTISYPLAAT